MGTSLTELAGTRHLRFPNEGRSLRYQNHEKSGFGFVSGEMLLPHPVFVFAGRAVEDGDAVLFCPGPQAPAESACHAHQMVVVEVGIATVQSTPPDTQAAPGLAHPEESVQNHAVDAVVAAFQ